jgi:hypothetical protein
MQQIRIKVDDGKAKVTLLSSGNRTMDRMQALITDMMICQGSLPLEVSESAQRLKTALNELRERMSG